MPLNFTGALKGIKETWKKQTILRGRDIDAECHVTVADVREPGQIVCR